MRQFTKIIGQTLFFCLLGLGLLTPGLTHAATRTFSERYSINATGDIYLIGNTAMTCDTSGTNGGTCLSARAGTATTGTQNNNNSYSMIYVDVDADGSTFQSSSADLNMPAGSTVLWAGLYWAAEFTALPAGAARDQILMRTPGSGSYATINASQDDSIANVGCPGNTCDRYSAFADVTNQVRAAGNGTYTVANIRGWPNGASGASTYAGWSLVVAFSNPSLALRNLTIFDGYTSIACGYPNTVNIPVSGFLTPFSGPVITRLGALAGEGDLASTGDNFQLNGTNLVDPVRPLGNFFNTSITDLGSYVTTKNPNYINQLGWDIARINASNILANGSTGATITLTTSAECYYPSTVTFATDLYMPVVTPNVVKTGVDVNGGNLVPGDILRYTISMTNTGFDTAQNLILTDPIPAFTTYVPGSLQILTGANPGVKTDVAGDDQAYYVAAAPQQVVFHLGTGANGTSGGSLALGQSTSIKFDVRLDDTIPAGTILSNSASLSYNGQTLGTVFAAASSAAASAIFVPPTATKIFSPNPVAVNGVATMTIQLTNPASNLGAITGASFNDVYPAGMVNATPTSPTISCTPGSTAGTLSGGVAGGNSIGMSGATITQGGSCTVTARVTSAAQGNYVNNVGSVTTTNAGNTVGATASATFSVGQPTITKAFGAASILAGASTTATFVLANPVVTGLTGVTFSDSMPAGLVVAAGATTNSCGGTLTATVGTGTITLANGSLAASGSCIVTVPVTSNTGGIYDNTTSGVTTAQTSLGPVSNTARLLVYAPVTGVKSFTPPSISAGGFSLLSITVSNPNPAGMAAVTGVAFTDTYPAGLLNTTTPNPLITCTAGSSGTITGGASGGNTIGLSGGTLVSGGSCTIKANVTSAAAGNRINTTSVISSTNAGTGTAASATLNVSTLTPPGTSKSFAPATVARNQSSIMTITLTNSNGSAITGAALNDSYPAGLVNATAPNPTTTCAGGTVNATAGGNSLTLSGATIPASGSCTVTVSVSSPLGDNYYNNTGLVTTSNAGVGLGGAGNLAVLTPTQVSKSFAPNPVAPNVTSVLTITLTNPPENAVALTGVGIIDTYPAGLINRTPTAAATTCSGGIVTATAGGNSITLSGASIPVNSSCQVTVNVFAATAGNYVNTTGVVTSTIAGDGGTATRTLQVGAPGVSKAFSVSPIIVGATTRLTVTLTNPTSVAMTSAAFIDSYPAGMTNTATPATASTCGGTVTAAASGNSLTFSGGTIPANSSCNVSVNVTATATVTNTIAAGAVTVAGGATNGNPASINLVVTPPPEASKSFTPDTIPAGGPSVLTIIISNPTSTTVTGVAFTDTYPAGLVNTGSASPTINCTAGSSGTRTGGANNGNTLGMSGGSLLGNGSCTLTVNVTSAAAGSRVNSTGAITSTNGGTGTAATATLIALAPMTAVKSFTPSAVSAGDTTVLTVLLTNPNATTAITGVAFTDNYPPGLTNDAPPSPLNTCGGTLTAVAGGASLSLSGGTIPAGGSCSASVTVTTTSNNKTNPAFSVTSGNTNSATAAAATLTVAANAAPTVTKSFSPAQITTGDVTTISIVMENTSGTRLRNGAFTDTYPVGLVNANPTNASVSGCRSGASASATAGGNSLVFSGEINGGSTCTVTVDVTSDTPGVYTNTIPAVTSGTHGTGGPASDTLIVVLPPPTVAKSFSPGSVTANTASAMTITIINPNTTALTSASFTDAYPSGLINTATPGVVNTCGGTITAAAGGTALVLSGGTVPASGSCSVSVNVTGSGAGSFLNSTGPVYSGNAQNATAASGTLNVTLALPNMFVIKSANKATAAPGETITYTITLTNSGPGIATSVVLDDRLGQFSTLAMDTFGSGQPFNFTDGATLSGYAAVGTLTYSQDNGVDGYSYVPPATGSDPTITNWKMTMPTPMNGNGASFTIQYVQAVR